MPIRPNRNDLLLFLSGINLALLNYALIQHVSIAFRHLEIAVIVVSMSFFTGISLGYFFSDLISPRWQERILPVFLVIQLLTMATVQLLVYKIALITNWLTAYISAFILMTATSTPLYSIFLPSIVQTENRSLRRCYSIEIIGSLTGLAFVPLLTSFGHVWLLFAYCSTFLAIAWLFIASRVVFITLSLVTTSFLFWFGEIDRKLSTIFYKWRFDSAITDVIYTWYSPYHKIDVAKTTEDSTILFLNSQWQFSREDYNEYCYYAAEYPVGLFEQPDVCVLGCGSMSTVGRIGEISGSIKIVDIDKKVFETSRIYFQEYNRLDELDNWTFISDDAKHFLGAYDERFEVIIDDIPPAMTRQIALTYTQEFFRLIKSRLTEDGIFSMPLLTSVYSRRDYGRKVIATMASVFENYFILQTNDVSYFFGGGTGLKLDKRKLFVSINKPHQKGTTIVMPDEIRELTKETKIITVNNMAELIFDTK